MGQKVTVLLPKLIQMLTNLKIAKRTCNICIFNEFNTNFCFHKYMHDYKFRKNV